MDCPCERCEVNDAIKMVWYINPFEFFGSTKKVLIHLCSECLLKYKDYIQEPDT